MPAVAHAGEQVVGYRLAQLRVLEEQPLLCPHRWQLPVDQHRGAKLRLAQSVGWGERAKLGGVGGRRGAVGLARAGLALALLATEEVVDVLERGGIGNPRPEQLAAMSLTHWLSRLEDRLDDAVRLAGEQRVRVWRIYLRAARSGFRTGFTSVYQVRAHPA